MHLNKWTLLLIVSKNLFRIWCLNTQVPYFWWEAALHCKKSCCCRMSTIQRRPDGIRRDVRENKMLWMTACFACPCPFDLGYLWILYLSVQTFLKSHKSQYIIDDYGTAIKTAFLIKIFILSDQTGSWGADRAARHGRAGKRLPGPQHPCL